MVQSTKQPLVLEKIFIELKGKELIAIDETIAPGEVLSVMGPSGSGKSSLLAFIAGFLDPAFNAGGRALLGERVLTTLPAEERRVGMLFQDPLLFPHMSVEENLLFAVPQSVNNASERMER
ncbi:MAG: ATP-binding cassette domain-containing protein, partial [Rhizobiaceae bacterium]|nr:ATP-binding cassette domain-containing protein [Rhizobiaceae bacterium]